MLKPFNCDHMWIVCRDVSNARVKTINSLAEIDKCERTCLIAESHLQKKLLPLCVLCAEVCQKIDDYDEKQRICAYVVFVRTSVVC